MTQKIYQDMSAEEQLQWVTEFGELMAQHEAMIIAVGKRQQTMTLEGAKAVQRVFALLAAWPFAQDFCEKAQKYGDYMTIPPGPKQRQHNFHLLDLEKPYRESDTH